MNATIRRLTTLLTMLAVTSTAAFSANYDLAKSTPIGSWQLRQELTTDASGKQQLSEIRTSMVGAEKREGVDYVWVEMAIQQFKVKKGVKGNPNGNATIVKVLLEKSLMSGKPEEVFNNMRGMGKEIIMQTGDSEPMKIEEGGMMGGALMQALGMEIDYQFKDAGSEKLDTPSGKVACKIMEGQGSVTAKIVFKTIRVDSKIKQWLSDDVPFGIVKSEAANTTDGKTSTVEGKLLEFGKSGAVSQIKGEPKSLEIPGLGKLFGN